MAQKQEKATAAIPNDKILQQICLAIFRAKLPRY